MRFDPEDSELRIWDYVEGDLIERALVPDEPAECLPLGLFWVVVPDEETEVPLRLARDTAGKDLLPTPVEGRAEAEAARAKAEAEAEAARAERDVARAESEAALERVRLLEAEVARLR